ncbi:uncharacterized protein EI97DRAFT_34797 [Westerdykella ornata]|uniref:Uncharacterized protein n=1 Tax=Westerdykella ornata TaxID=318751 RepID=A0A6A6K0H0_WESOR|nr:uncharacterized protein EI97DRAFT_34797 [Westerdykella ornata]KAF2281618.1 hypothetical protein EI97DRAFT_34797 [Westerdykella ornata]
MSPSMNSNVDPVVSGGTRRAHVWANPEPSWPFASVSLPPQHPYHLGMDSRAAGYILMLASLHDSPAMSRPLTSSPPWTLSQQCTQRTQQTTAYRMPAQTEVMEFGAQPSIQPRPTQSSAVTRTDYYVPQTSPRPFSPTLPEVFEQVERGPYGSTPACTLQPSFPCTPPRAPSPTESELFEEVERVRHESARPPTRYRLYSSIIKRAPSPTMSEFIEQAEQARYEKRRRDSGSNCGWD